MFVMILTPLPCSFNSTLRPRDRSFPYRNGILDWGTSEFPPRGYALKILCVQMKQFRKQLKLVSLTCALTSHSVVNPSFPPFHALSSDVQAGPHCRNDRIPGHDHHDLYLGLCAP
jgi:hypothetical protein